jgi:diguanylate cyclase
LREAARRLRAAVRTTDFVGRYGGEEFVVALPGATLRDAVTVGERVRASIAGAPFGIHSGPLVMTASVGVATAWNLHETSQLLNTADAALYRAKAAGRNRVEADFHAAA